LQVAGAVTASGAVNVSGALAASTLTVSARATVTGSTTLSATLAAASGTFLSSTLAVTSAATFSATLSVVSSLFLLSDFVEVTQIATPANPATGKRRIFMDASTGKLHVQTATSGSVSLEEQGGGGGGGAPTDAQYLTLATHATLTAERVFTPGNLLSAVDGGAGAAYTLHYNPLDLSVLDVREDFLGGGITDGTIGQYGWRLVTIGGAPVATRLSGGLSNPGLVRISTTATAGQGGCLALGDNTSAGAMLSGLSNMSAWAFRWKFQLQVSGGTNFYIGLLNQVNVSNPADFIGIRYNSQASVGDTGFNFVCLKGTVSTKVSLASANGNSGMHNVTIRMDTSGTVICEFDTLASQSITTNLPAVGLTPAMTLVTLSALSKQASVDFFGMKVKGLNR